MPATGAPAQPPVRLEKAHYLPFIEETSVGFAWDW